LPTCRTLRQTFSSNPVKGEGKKRSYLPIPFNPGQQKKKGSKKKNEEWNGKRLILTPITFITAWPRREGKKRREGEMSYSIIIVFAWGTMVRGKKRDFR